MADRTVSCPDCGSSVQPDVEQLCPHCGYPLMFLREPPDDDARSAPRAPGVPDDATIVMPPALPEPAPSPPARLAPELGEAAPAAGRLDCPQCGNGNEPERVRCERCGMELRGTWPVAVVLPPPTATLHGRRRLPTWLWALCGAVVLALLATGSYFVFGKKDPVPVAAAHISVKASSVSRDHKMVAKNVLDGKTETMWQTDGEQVTGNVGVTLTFRFTPAVKLTEITVTNGAAVNDKAYLNNERLQRVLITTNTGVAETWDLQDTSQPQSLPLKAVTTSWVTLTVEKTYPGKTFTDLAVTDVTFEHQL
ncbi:NADase-type glycan-binding domain-containing protein [Actinoplanes regularis]|uniref:Zinc-ribbon domain-containing protein n=1 Tax=Actinoplanes regularis TaxID=52697 RepID=A0A239FMX0_9ACTN|nr:zinc-ribbon domain-containing protein [Actinoplanes regularis]GIE89676.1 hypothetical protein Are01nite_61560 [Actinoplanes regularis]SNS57968.1 zinc-ribbon domain-containing protein [Actinoplanes regularis]